MVRDGLFTRILGGLVASPGTVLVTKHVLLRGVTGKRGPRGQVFPDYVIPEA